MAVALLLFWRHRSWQSSWNRQTQLWLQLQLSGVNCCILLYITANDGYDINVFHYGSSYAVGLSFTCLNTCLLHGPYVDWLVSIQAKVTQVVHNLTTREPHKMVFITNGPINAKCQWCSHQKLKVCSMHSPKSIQERRHIIHDLSDVFCECIEPVFNNPPCSWMWPKATLYTQLTVPGHPYCVQQLIILVKKYFSMKFGKRFRYLLWIKCIKPYSN